MRRHVEVKTESHGGTNHEKTGAVNVSRGMMPVSHAKGLMDAFDEMERWMEETLHRPFLFDVGMRPFGRMIHNLRNTGEVIPSVDVFTEGGDVVLKAELAGMRREDINVQLVDHDLIISGEKTGEETIDRKNYLRRERSYGAFNRTVRLPEGVNAEKVTASFKNGILEVRIPRTETHDVRTIQIE